MSQRLRVQIPLFAQFYFFINPSYLTSEEIFVLGPSRMIIFRSAKQVKMESKQCCRNPMSHIWRNKFQKAALACECTAKTCIELLKLVWILKQYEWLKKPSGNGIRVKFTRYLVSYLTNWKWVLLTMHIWYELNWNEAIAWDNSINLLLTQLLRCLDPFRSPKPG